MEKKVKKATLVKSCFLHNMNGFVFKYWLEVFFAGILSLVIYIFKEYIGLKYGIKSLLRNEIVRIYETYTKLGYCPSYMKENLNEIYISYHKLNGNGMATAMMEEIFKLPNQKKE